MDRPTRFASRIQGQTRQLAIRSPTMQADDGRRLAVGLHENMNMRQREVEEARRKMQMKYNEEAEEAARKKKEKEQKKREAWLARQEALVRPGHVLGKGPSEKNLLRDYMEHAVGDECQQHMGQTEQHWMDQQYNALVQQGIERQMESVQLQRRQERSEGVTPSRPGDIARHGAVSGSGPPNRTSEYFLGTGYSPSPARSNGKGHVAQAHTVSPGSATGSSSTAFHSNSRDQAAGANLGHVLGTGNATSPKSDSYEPDVQLNHREEMLAARRRFQEQYDAQLKEAAKAKEDEAKDTAERCDCSSSN